MKYTIPAVIFTGGKSSRMGQDKSLLPFSNHDTLVAYQYHRLKALFQTVYLSSKQQNYPFTNAVIPDLYEGYSPMVGLVSVLGTLNENECFILSVDAPFVGEKIIDPLLACSCTGDAIIARNKGKVQPLCGIYRKSILPLAKEELQHDRHKMGQLLKNSNTCYVDFKEEGTFMNLNRPEEYQEALSLLKS